MAQNPTLVLTAAGTSQWVAINLNAFRFGVGLIAVFNANGVQGATCAFSALVTGQDPTIFNPNGGYGGPYPFGPSGPTFFGLHDVIKNVAGSVNSSLAYPCTAMALQATQLTAGATLALSIVQVVN